MTKLVTIALLASLSRTCNPQSLVVGQRVLVWGNCGTVVGVSPPKHPEDGWHILTALDGGYLTDDEPAFVQVTPTCQD